MKHKARRNSYRNGRNWNTCQHCGKRTYPTKTEAKQAARQLHDACRGPYMCESGSGWHCGRLPEAVKTGATTRAEWYGCAA